MKHYKIINNVTGWIVFLIAAYTYCSTIEPTASFWDCPEFISSAYLLEIGHPPGAPFFMLVGNLFSQFASDTTQVAKMINIMNALLSAGCILFLFWSITHLARKILENRTTAPHPSLCDTLSPRGEGKVSNVPSKESTLREKVTSSSPFGERMPEGLVRGFIIMCSGIAGSLIYTWSDTFWFSAVEGEVYAFSSFFTALAFWLILKWEDEADSPRSDRWIILIAYLIGLSIGVHLLNLLCIPSIILVCYYKKAKKPNAKGTILMLILSALLIAVVLFGIVPGVAKVGGWFELLFTNVLGMPFNTGLIIYISLLAISLAVALWRAKKRWLHTSLLCLTMMLIGYGSYAVIFIRSAANPMMDENSPDNIFALGSYLGREQYGDKPLLYGQTYCSEPEITVDEKGKLMYATTEKGAIYRPTSTPSLKGRGVDSINSLTNTSADKPATNKSNYSTPFMGGAEGRVCKYIKIGSRIEMKYPSNQCMFFPRIHSNRHAALYEEWLGETHKHPVEYNVPGQYIPQTIEIPSMGDNLRFFFNYQLNFMYWRYFLWNFAGRQNDIQGQGEAEHGNWLSGFSWLDNLRLGDQSLLPSELKENKAHNVFYCMPLFLGFIGLVWQFFRDKKSRQQFWVVSLLFFMTGIAIVLYVNQTPCEPRERDYSYVGSFYAFAIWCGLGVTAIWDMISKKYNYSTTASHLSLCDTLSPRGEGEVSSETLKGISYKRKKVTFSSPLGERMPAGQVRGLGNGLLLVFILVITFLIPLQMVSQTWDDHDRSNRYMCRDCGQNYLETTDHDAILFTNGDNETFPLWYNQDTEGKRTDVRVCNLQYLQTDWYIDQMKRPAFSGKGMSSPLPISWTHDQYMEGVNEYIEINPIISDNKRLRDTIEYIMKENPELALRLWGNDPFELGNAIRKFVLKQYDNLSPEEEEWAKSLPVCLPSDSLHITVDKDAVRRSGMKLIGEIPDRMEISLKGRRSITKNYALVLEMIAQSNFSRPIYFTIGSGPDSYGELYHFFIQEGLAWRVTPFYIKENKMEHGLVTTICDTDKMFTNMMEKYKYGNTSMPGIYIDETTGRMCASHRRCFAKLAVQLCIEHKYEKALQVLERSEKEIPTYNLPHSYVSGSLDMVDAYQLCGKTGKATKIYQQLEKTFKEYQIWRKEN